MHYEVQPIVVPVVAVIFSRTQCIMSYRYEAVLITSVSRRYCTV